MKAAETIKRAFTAIVAGEAALLPLLIEQHVISAAVGTDIGVTQAAILAAWHGGTALQTANAARTDRIVAAALDSHNYPTDPPATTTTPGATP